MRYYQLLSFFLIWTLLPTRGHAQASHPYYGITCGTRDTVVDASVLAPAAVIEGTASMETEFILDFGPDIPQEAEAAITFAAEVWGSFLQSDVPIRVNVNWEEQENERSLASAGPATLFRDFPEGIPNTWYAVALAEALTGRDLNETDEPDINIVANSEANWYFGLDGRTPRNRIDLATVILHELGHGLGFLSSVDTISDTTAQIGFAGRFISYDLFLETEDGFELTDVARFPNPSPELLEAIINRLDFAGDRATEENGGTPVPLFAPATFDVGSSVSHLDERAYPAGSENALMTPFVAAGEAVHRPGPITLGIFFDQGWPLIFDVMTSIRETVAGRLNAFPNPADDRVFVDVAGVETDTWAVLYGPDGRQVLRQRIAPAATRVEFDTSDLPPGVYTAFIAARNNRAYTARVVLR